MTTNSGAPPPKLPDDVRLSYFHELREFFDGVNPAATDEQICQLIDENAASMSALWELLLEQYPNGARQPGHRKSVTAAAAVAPGAAAPLPTAIAGGDLFTLYASPRAKGSSLSASSRPPLSLGTGSASVYSPLNTNVHEGMFDFFAGLDDGNKSAHDKHAEGAGAGATSVLDNSLNPAGGPNAVDDGWGDQATKSAGSAILGYTAFSVERWISVLWLGVADEDQLLSSPPDVAAGVGLAISADIAAAAGLPSPEYVNVHSVVKGLELTVMLQLTPLQDRQNAAQRLCHRINTVGGIPLPRLKVAYAKAYNAPAALLRFATARYLG